MPFLKSIKGSVLKVFQQLWFACNICQCFVIAHFRFGNARLNATDNGIRYFYDYAFVGEAVVFN